MTKSESVGIVAGHIFAMLDNANSGINRMKFITLATAHISCHLSKQNLEPHGISSRAGSFIFVKMWTNAQPDGRPAEYRWRPVFNAAKFGWRSLLECRAVTLSRRETGWNLQGCPKLANRFQSLVGRSSPYYQDMWSRYCCLTIFPIVDTYLSSEDIARHNCAMAMVPKW